MAETLPARVLGDETHPRRGEGPNSWPAIQIGESPRISDETRRHPLGLKNLDELLILTFFRFSAVIFVMAAKFVRLTTRTARWANLERLGHGRVISGGFHQISPAEGPKKVPRTTAGGSEATFCATDLIKSVRKAVNSVAELTQSVTDSVHSVTELTKSVGWHGMVNSVLIRSGVDLTQSVMESIKSVTQLTQSATESVKAVMDLIKWFTDLIHSATLFSAFDRDGHAAALPMTLSVPDQNTSATDQPRHRERGFRTPARVS